MGFVQPAATSFMIPKENTLTHHTTSALCETKRARFRLKFEKSHGSYYDAQLFKIKVTAAVTAKTVVTLFTKCLYLTIRLSTGSDTWASTIYCVSIKKLKKLVRRCELRRSLHVSVFTIESVLCLIHLQNTSFMFGLHQFLDS